MIYCIESIHCVIVIGDHGYDDGNQINGIIDLMDRGIGVRQLFLMGPMDRHRWTKNAPSLFCNVSVSWASGANPIKLFTP